MTIWRKMGDDLKNGAVLGAVLGATMAWGNYVYSWLLINVPAAWVSVIPLWLYLVIIGGIVGYLIDRH